MVRKDARKIIEAILHLYYGIKAPKRFYDQVLKLMFFELGKQERDGQYHVHILSPRRRHKDIDFRRGTSIFGDIAEHFKVKASTLQLCIFRIVLGN